MTGAQIVIDCLLQEQVDTLFCYIGGQVIPIFDALHRYGQGIRLIHPRHEQAGIHAADGYARVSGKTGVALVTSGPGATNTVTGIATAYMDSIPLVVICGQVPTGKIGTDAFQEADITGITMPITKASFLVRQVDELAGVLAKAFKLAQSGRPGPVLVDIPSDLQLQATQSAYERLLPDAVQIPPSVAYRNQLQHVLTLLQQAARPVALVGGGVTFSGAAAMANRFLDRFDLPAVCTLMGHGVLPDNRELMLGGIGMHGTLYGNFALQHADVIVALGTRFSDRILGDPFRFAPNAQIIQIDIDAAELGKNKHVAVPILGDVATVLADLLRLPAHIGSRHAWLAELAAYKTAHPLAYARHGTLKPQYLIEQARQAFPADAIVVSDVGQNQMWVSQYFRFGTPRSYLSSGGLGTMGYALPAAIGAKLAAPDRDVLMVAGDGGFAMNIQELATLKHYGLNVKMLVLDNGCLGMVRQWQELLCEKRYSGTMWTAGVNYADIAAAFGIQSMTIGEWSQAPDAMRALADSREPMLLHAYVDADENVLPMIPPGKSFDHVLTKI